MRIQRKARVEGGEACVTIDLAWINRKSLESNLNFAWIIIPSVWNFSLASTIIDASISQTRRNSAAEGKFCAWEGKKAGLLRLFMLLRHER